MFKNVSIAAIVIFVLAGIKVESQSLNFILGDKKIRDFIFSEYRFFNNKEDKLLLKGKIISKHFVSKFQGDYQISDKLSVTDGIIDFYKDKIIITDGLFSIKYKLIESFIEKEIDGCTVERRIMRNMFGADYITLFYMKDSSQYRMLSFQSGDPNKESYHKEVYVIEVLSNYQD